MPRTPITRFLDSVTSPGTVETSQRSADTPRTVEAEVEEPMQPCSAEGAPEEMEVEALRLETPDHSPEVRPLHQTDTEIRAAMAPLAGVPSVLVEAVLAGSLSGLLVASAFKLTSRAST